MSQDIEAKKAPSSAWRPGTLIAVASLIIAIVALVLVIQQPRQAHQNTQKFTQFKQTLLQTQQTLNANLTAKVQSLQHQVNLTTRYTGSQAALVQVDYLVRLAHLNLALGHNAKTGLTLLQLADRRLAEINDPTAKPVRAALYNTIAALQAIPPVDTTAVLLHLDGLNKQIQTLRLIPNTITTPVASTKPTATKGWRRFFDATLAHLKNIVIIQNTAAPQAAILPVTATPYLKANIQLQIQEAQLAVLRQQPALYKRKLAQAASWLHTYFKQNPKTAGIVAALNTLSQKNILPDLPDAMNILNALKAYHPQAGDMQSTPPLKYPLRNGEQHHEPVAKKPPSPQRSLEI